MASGLFYEGSDVVIRSTGLFREDLKLLIEEYLEGREVSEEFEWYPCRTLALYVKQVVAAFDEGCMHAMRTEPVVEYGPLVVPSVVDEFADKGFSLNGYCFAAEDSSGTWNGEWFAGQYRFVFTNGKVLDRWPQVSEGSNLKQLFQESNPAVAEITQDEYSDALGRVVSRRTTFTTGFPFRYALQITKERADHINKYFGMAKKDGTLFVPELAAKIIYGEMD
jgi:hypothetical protein